MKKLHSRLTYSNVISSLALFLVLVGGSAYAATQMLPKNSVGANQLKKGAVTPAKLSSASKATLTGLRGPQGSQGPAGQQGVPGVPGKAGANLTAETPLASGQTETGVFGDGGGGAGDSLLGIANFVQPLSAPLDGAHALILKQGESSIEHCPGAGRADPGYFCAYTTEESNATRIFSIAETPATGEAGAGPDGAQMFYSGTAAGANVYGTWAVTAP